MRGQITLLAFLLLLWKLIAIVNCQTGEPTGYKITVDNMPEGIKLSCEKGHNITLPNNTAAGETLELPYSDLYSGEYTCNDEHKIYVKFRTCDNCIELDAVAIAGIAIGDLVATVLIGVAVYLIASRVQAGPLTSNKKSSDRQHLILNDNSSRDPGEMYQRLRPSQKDEYDVLNKK